jgi:hypothetical protein
MTYNPLKRDSTWTMVQPGCWLDPAGCGHIFPDEVIAELQRQHPEAGFEFTKQDYDLIVSTFVDLMREELPAVQLKIVQHEREAEA